MAAQPNQYVWGQQVRLLATFTNAAGAKVEPTSPKFKVKDGGGVVTEYAAPTKVELGVYEQLVTITEAAGGASATWSYRAESTGGTVAAGEQTFVVLASVF